MADESNPFADIYSAPSAPETAAPAQSEGDNPFADIYKDQSEDTSAFGAAFHSFERGIIPALTSIPGMGAGAEIGAGLGALGGPAAPITVPVGGVIGGLVGALATSWAASSAQDFALKQLPENWQDALGQSQKQQQAEAEKQPVASFIGGLVPYALTMRPSFNMATRALPENATAIQRLMANPLTAHLFGGAVTGGMELGSEAANKESPNWTKIGIATAFGTIFNTPTKIGEALTEVGARPARTLMGRPEPTAPAVAPEQAPAAPAAQAEAAVPKPAAVTSKDWNETILGQKPEQPTTVAQAGDAKVLGPGIDEAVFMGAHEQAPEALMTAQDAARTEAAFLRPEESTPSVMTVARRMEPELFSHYYDLTAQRSDLQARLEAAPAVEAAALDSQLAATEAELRTVEPEIGAAYRRAADVTGSEVVEPPAPEPVQSTQPAPEGQVPTAGAPTEISRETQPVQSIAEQEAMIAADITRQLIAAGRPEEEAQLLGKLGGRRALTRAARLGNPNGALALYQQEGAIIRSGERTPPSTPPAPAAPLMPTRERPNIAPENITGNIPVNIPEPAQGVAAPEIAPKVSGNSEVQSLDPNAIGVDAERFQFKSGGDEHGVTERLQDISKWEPHLAGTVLVFRDEAGKDWIADGHQRLALAKRLMAGGHPPIKINAFVLDARDGITDERARAIAAIKNIAEGTGTATDAAKVLREAKATGIKLPQLPPRSRLVRDGTALAQLGPEAFGIVVNEAVPENYGAIVGRLVQDPADQVEALRLLARFKPDNAQQAELIVRDMMETGTEVYRQQSLFGEEAFAGSVVLERAKIADEALKQLRRDKSTFRTLVDEAERIQGAGGNVLDQEANQGRLSTDERAADFLKQLAFRAGPVSDALSDVARKLKSGEIKVGEAARTFLGDVRGAVENGVATGDHAGGAERGAEGERGLEGPTFFQRKPPAETAERAEITARLLKMAEDGDVEGIKASPELQALVADMRSRPATDTTPGYGTEAWAGDRTYTTPTGDLRGVDAAYDYLMNNARNLAADQLGIPRYEVAKEHKAVIVIGPPAAGKSTIANQLALKLKAAIPDPDEAKKIMPEYDNGMGSNAVHEESSFLTGYITEELKRGGENMVIPKIGGNVKSISGLSESLKHWGYTVDVVLMDVDPAEAFRRMIGRYVSSGRLIPPDYFETVAKAPAKAFETLRNEGAADGYAKVHSPRGVPARISETSLRNLDLPVGTEVTSGGRRADRGTDRGNAASAGPESAAARIESEPGVQGRAQTLIPGVSPITDADRIALEAGKPLRGGAAPPARGSLFDVEGREDAARQGTLFQPAPAPNTPEFNRWFGESKAVTDDGDPEVVYHGTNHKISQFKPTPGMRNDDGSPVQVTSPAFFFTPERDTARRFARDRVLIDQRLRDKPGGRAQTAAYYLSVQNPLDLTGHWTGHPNPETAEVLSDVLGNIYDPPTSWVDVHRFLDDPDVVSGLRAEGFDGVKLREGDGATSWAVFDPTQIKSVNNRGTFDPNDPRILYQRGSKFGSIDMDRAGHYRIIKLFRDADASTFLHESGHQWLDEVLRDALHPQATDPLKADATTVRKWLGMKDDQAAPTTRQHERWARAIEQYFREGIAPSKELAGAFAKFRTWLLDIYNTLRGLGAPISEDVRGVFDRLIEVEPNRTVISPEDVAREPSLPSIHEADVGEASAHEAPAIADRIVAEKADYLTRQPPEVQNELASTIAQHQEEDRAAAGAEPGTETGAGAGGPSAVVAGGGPPGPEPAGGPGGVEPSQELGSGRGGVSEGNGGAGEPGADAGLRNQRPQSAGAAGAHPLAPTPATLFGPAESPFVDKAGNIRIENLTSDQDVAQAIRDAAQENNDFIGDRRGVITDGQVLDLADALGMDASKLNQRKLGEAFNAEQVVAARKLLIQSATDVRDIMAKAAAPTATDEDVLAYAHAKARHQMIQAQVAGITAEAGRALRAFRSLAGDAQAMGMDQFLRSATGKTLFQLKEEAKLGATLDTPMKVSKFVRDAQKRTFGSMVLEYWINGLISGPATHTTYMVGNVILSLEKAGPETLTAALIGNAARALGRQGEVVHFGEAVAKLRGAHLGIPAATKAALDALRTGVTTRLPGETPRVLPFQPGSELARSVGIDESVRYSDAMPALYGAVQGIQDGVVALGALLKAGGVQGAPLVGLRHSPLGAIPDIAVRGVDVLPLGTVARLPSRMIASIHSFFRTVNYSMEKNALAYRSAVDSGKTGTAFDAHVANLRQNPTADMMESAVHQATEATLMGKGSEFVQALSKLTNVKILGFPFLKFVDPFVHIAGNIIDQSIVQRSPLGLLSPSIREDLMGKNGTIAQDTAAARMLVGTALSIGFGSLAAQGLMSGSGPSDPREATIWRMAGNQAHSVRIGDTWYDIHRLGPIGMLGSVAADMYDVAHGASEGDMGKVGAALLQAFTHTMLDEGFGRGPADLIQALTDPQRYGPAYVRNQISSFVPFSVGMGQVARATDPYSRQARSIMDAIKAKIPGLSQTLMPRRDIWGQALPGTEVLGQPGFSAIYTTQVNNDAVNHALLNLGIFPAQVDHKIRGVALTDEQFDQYSVLAGGMAKQQLDKIVNSPQWSQWPAQTQHDVIEATISSARNTAREMLMARFPAIPAAALHAKLAQLQPDAGE